jgi:hypothetical protein
MGHARQRCPTASSAVTLDKEELLFEKVWLFYPSGFSFFWPIRPRISARQAVFDVCLFYSAPRQGTLHISSQRCLPILQTGKAQAAQ